VRDGIDGYHFPPGDAASLAQLLARLAALPHRLPDLNRTLRSPPAPAEAAAQYAALYQRVCLAAR
jgi:glycosyltransferase involved in cell wall biosynthesis